MIGKFEDLSGKRFNYFKVIEYAGNSYWRCLCDCGNIKNIKAYFLKKNRTKSCGCKTKFLASSSKVKHGHYKNKKASEIYVSWGHMKGRCHNKNDKSYVDYGGRGIKVCNRWLTFETFLEDMGSTWSKGLTLDRIDNNGNYEPNNCRWTTAKIQAKNRRPQNRLKISGLNLAYEIWDWSDSYGL